MTTYYAAAKYQLRAEPSVQWRELSDLTMVAVELVRLALELNRDFSDVERVFEDATAAAEEEWEEATAR